MSLPIFITQVKSLVASGLLVDAEKALLMMAEEYGEAAVRDLATREPAQTFASLIGASNGNDVPAMAFYMPPEKYVEASLLAMSQYFLEPGRSEREVMLRARDIFSGVVFGYLPEERKEELLRAFAADDGGLLILLLAAYDCQDDEQNHEYADLPLIRDDNPFAVMAALKHYHLYDAIISIEAVLFQELVPTITAIAHEIVHVVEELTRGQAPTPAEHRSSIFMPTRQLAA
ncbi:MAG: hypothetical protein WCK11_01405 [Candidatus Falkowbacteria bacterium]